jgi:hypothetical protein
VEDPRKRWYSRGLIGGEFADAVRKVTRKFVLHSTNDLVLKLLFPSGQTAAREGLMPEAVGLHGGPDMAWSGRGDTGLGHSGYWAHPSAAPAALRAIGHASNGDLLTLQGLQRVTWRLAAVSDLPDRSLRSRNWHTVGTHQTLTETP